jgi:streptogramin lyase
MRRGAGEWREVRGFSSAAEIGRLSATTAFLYAAMLLFPALSLGAVTSHGGPVQSQPHVYEIFWGSNWNKKPTSGERVRLELMYQELSNSSWQGILTQYWGLDGFVSKSLTIGTPYTDTAVQAPTGINLTKIVTEVRSAIAANPSWPQTPASPDQFVVFVPPGATYASEADHANCGFHGEVENEVVYAYVGWDREESGQVFSCSRTVAAAHEYAESVTDPFLDAWRHWSFNEEIADLCGGAERGLLPGGIEVPSLWDNYLGHCATSDSTPAQIKPEAIAEAPSGVKQTAATLNGDVKPNNVEISSYEFEWGTTESYGHSTSLQAWTKGLGNSPVSAEITGLSPATTYHYRLVVLFPSGDRLTSGDRQLQTGPPTNTSLPAISPSSPAQGLAESTTTGTWSGEPTSYGYQWERCPAACGEWKPIPGATAPSYLPGEADVGYSLRATVTARTSGGEEASASSLPAGPVRALGELTEYPLPGKSSARGVVEGPDGNIWFTESGTSKIGKITPAGTITEYPLPANSEPRSITAGPDGKLWFTESASSKIGKITTSGEVTEYSLPKSSGPIAIVAGPDGNLWFTACYSDKIGKITTSGTITEYVPAAGGCMESIAVGPDGNLWFTCMLKNVIGKMTTSGAITEYTAPQFTYPHYITAGPDGNMWYTTDGYKLGKITTAGTRTEYSVPSGPQLQIATGADGNLWFTIQQSKIGRMTTSGVLTVFPVSSSPWGIVSGPKGDLWFTRISGGDAIGTIVP